MATKATESIDTLTLARRATNYAALPENERRERIHIAAWHCVCIAQARRFVREVALVEDPTGTVLHGYGRAYGEKLSQHQAADDTRGVDY